MSDAIKNRITTQSGDITTHAWHTKHLAAYDNGPALWWLCPKRFVNCPKRFVKVIFDGKKKPLVTLLFARNSPHQITLRKSKVKFWLIKRPNRKWFWWTWVCFRGKDRPSGNFLQWPCLLQCPWNRPRTVCFFEFRSGKIRRGYFNRSEIEFPRVQFRIWKCFVGVCACVFAVWGTSNLGASRENLHRDRGHHDYHHEQVRLWPSCWRCPTRVVCVASATLSSIRKQQQQNGPGRNEKINARTDKPNNMPRNSSASSISNTSRYLLVHVL